MMREQIFEYLVEKENQTPKLASQMCDKFEKHPDIMKELVEYINTEMFTEVNPVTVEGYTAKMLKETTYLKPVGAFNYLIYLRNKPEIALDKLRKGLPLK